MTSPATREILDRIGGPAATRAARPATRTTASHEDCQHRRARPAPSPQDNQMRSKLASGAQTEPPPSAPALGATTMPETKPVPPPAKARPIEAAAKTQPSYEPGSKPKEARTRFPKPGARRIEARIATLALMRERWPAAFNIDRPVPLAIGADKIVRAELDADDMSITDVFRWWTSHPVYLQALTAGGPCYGLNGCPSGEVTEENRQHARGRRAQRHPPAKPVKAEPAGLDNVEPT